MKRRKTELIGALKFILVLSVLSIGIGIGIAAWDDTKSTSDTLTAAEWNAHVTDQKNRTITATTVVAMAGSPGAFAADYICDGVSDNVQIASAVSNGGKIYIHEGNYDINGQITIPSDTYIVGTSGTLFTIHASSSETIGFLTNNDHTNGNDNIVIEGLHINANGANQTEALVMIYLEDVTNSKVLNCEMENLRSESGVERSTMVLVKGASSNITISDNYFHDSVTETDQRGWSYPIQTNASSSIITNNRICNMYGELVMIPGSDHSIISNNIFKNQGCSPDEVHSAISVKGDYVLVDSNIIDHCCESGFVVSTNYGLYSNNIIRGSQTNPHDQIGAITLRGDPYFAASYNVFTGNTVINGGYTNTKYTVWIEGTDVANNNTFIGNDFSEGEGSLGIVSDNGLNNVFANNRGYNTMAGTGVA